MENGFLVMIKKYVWLISIAIGVTLWLFDTFSTNAAMAEKEKNIREYVDQKHATVETSLNGIKTVLDRVDQRVYELNRRSR